MDSYSKILVRFNKNIWQPHDINNLAWQIFTQATGLNIIAKLTEKQDGLMLLPQRGKKIQLTIFKLMRISTLQLRKAGYSITTYV